MVHLSRLAEDLIILCGDEHRFFELSDALSTGSSMMPQKKNPDPLELVRGKSGRAIGHLVGLLTTIKGLPTGYNKDLQEDKEAVFGAEDTVAGCLAVVRSVVDGLTLNRDRAAAAASGLLLATDVADYLVGRGVPFRRAHEIVGALVRKLVAEGRDFESLSLAEWRAASDLFDAGHRGARHARRVGGGQNARRSRRARGGPGPSAGGAALAGGRGCTVSVGGIASAKQALLRSAPPFALHSPPAASSGELMQQRQLRLGDILDDYCPRERRVTNHAVVAMVDADVKQTRCTTCDAEHEYKHAKVPRQRRKSRNAGRAVRAGRSPADRSGSRTIRHASAGRRRGGRRRVGTAATSQTRRDGASAAAGGHPANGRRCRTRTSTSRTATPTTRHEERDGEEDGPVHRPLIRASLPRPEGQPPPARPIPEFTIRQPGGRPNRFRPRGTARRGQSVPGQPRNGNMGGGRPRHALRRRGVRPQGRCPRAVRGVTALPGANDRSNAGPRRL